MKILYGINTNGQGHINRSRIFIDQLLKDGHEVQVLFAGKEPPQYAYEIAPKTMYKPGLVDYYKDHKVDLGKMFQVNMSNLPDYIKARRELLELDAQENFDMIISDFEPSSSVLGKKIGKPVICIDRQHAILHPAIETAPGKTHEKLGLRWVQNVMLPHYNHCYALDFTESIETADDITLFPLIWKPEFDEYDITQDDHITAYLQWFDPDKIVDVFSKYPRETFYVYGFDKEKTINNVHFKKTSRKGFLTDLVSCKAVIGNAGFNLAWEVCLLKKFMWIIPYGSQFEQITNAYRLQKMGQGYASEDLTTKDLATYLELLDDNNYRPNVDLTIKTASDLLAHVYTYYDEFQRENFMSRRQIRRSIKIDVNRWRLKQEIRNEVRLRNIHI